MGHAKDSNGIWGHSSEIATNHYVVFAVGDQSQITEKAFMGWAAANEISFKPLLGSYKGKIENSFIVNENDILAIAAEGWLKDQESVLHLGNTDSRDRRAAKLLFLTDGWPADSDEVDLGMYEKDLGVLVSVSKDEAMVQDEWTYDPQLKEYFITKSPDEIVVDHDAIRNISEVTSGIPYHELEGIIKAYVLLAKR